MKEEFIILLGVELEVGKQPRPEDVGSDFSLLLNDNRFYLGMNLDASTDTVTNVAELVTTKGVDNLEKVKGLLNDLGVEVPDGGISIYLIPQECITGGEGESW